MMEQKEIAKEEGPELILPGFLPFASTRSGAIKEFLDLVEIQKEMVAQKKAYTAAGPLGLAAAGIGGKEGAAPLILRLDESLSKILQPIEIEQDRSIVIVGKNIQRFLVTQPNILTIEKKNPDELLLTGKDIGYTYLHVWDEAGRRTLEFLTMPLRPKGPTLEETIRLAEEKAGNFKLRYTLDWTSYESGRRLNSLERSFYSWSHGLNLTGPTPYGDIDSAASIRSLRATTDLTYFTVGLTNAQFGPFKGFNLRGFDYSPPFSNLSFGGATLRGAMLASPAFNKRLDYSVFWGREGGGRYGNLSPGLGKIKNSFLSGFNLGFSPLAKQGYRFSLVHGWGRDRDASLNDYNYDLDVAYHLDKWGFNYEVAHDSEKLAHLLNATYIIPKLTLATEIRNIDKNFRTATGLGSRLGELGLLSNIYYTPSDKFYMASQLNLYQDRLYPSPENDNRWNEDFNWNANCIIDPLTSLRLDYSLQNELGRVGQFRYQSPGIALNRTFQLIKKLDTSVNYRHQENKNFSAPSTDYINDKVLLSLRFNLIGQVYYYVTKEFNWIEERFEGNRSQPEAMETGLSWSRQIAQSPFYGNIRFLYRDEENAASALSFMSGEDYIEGYSEFTYRPSPDKEAYCSSRIRNVWADNPSVAKRIEADFSAGMRYVWDTGIRWEAVGNIDGYIFKDLNADGLRQRDEPPVEGIKIWLGKDKSQVTDILGYYKFSQVKAKKAYVNIDVTTIPPGFVLTVPVTQEVAITHHQTIRVNFGIASRSEIMGMVFEDIDGDGQFSLKDTGIKGAVLILEDGIQAVTDYTGRYFFRNLATGKHALKLDLNSLPPNYLPKVPIFKEIELFEGVSYNYNIPLKKIEKR
jgi:hypothetical protein